MKKLLICCLATILSGSMLISCTAKDDGSKDTTGKPSTEQGSNEKPDENLLASFESKFKEAGYIPMPLERTKEEINELYFSNLGDIKFDETIEDYKLLETGRSPGVGFALVMKAKKGKVEDAKKIADIVLEKKVGDAFYPDEKEMAQKAEVTVKGDYVSILIFHDEVKEEALKSFNEIIK